MTEQLFDVFLAHNSADKPFVREINTKLKQRGLKTWIDEDQIAPGRSFQQAIQQAIPRVKTAAIILGKDGIGRWQNWEIEAFFSQLVNANKIVIPVLLPGLDKVPEDLTFLQQLRWINFENVEDRNSLELLIWGITGERSQQELKDNPLSTTSTETIQPSSFDADTYFNQGLAKSKLGDNQGAIADYNQAIKIKPDYAHAYIVRGLAKSDLGDNQDAIADYNQAIQIKPDYADAYRNRGLAKSNLGDKQGAIADYNQAIKIKPDYAPAYIVRALAKSNLEDNQGAIADCNQAIQIEPDYALAYIVRGIAKYNLGDKQGTIDEYKQAAELYLKQGKMKDYREALDNIKNLDQDIKNFDQPHEKGFWGNLFS
jgi:tetratricopeptide (TPR) repeat protein